IRRSFAYGEQFNGAARFFSVDHLGSVREATDNTNTLLTRYAFDPWGRRTLAFGSDDTTVGFTGHRSGASGSLWLSQYRAYDPEIGRWISDDPIGLDGDLNFSAYVKDSPITNIDPLGLQLYQPGAPPIRSTPSGCIAGPWRFVNHG